MDRKPGSLRDERVFAARWPVLVAVAFVALVSLGSFGFHLVVESQTATQTADLVNDSLRSDALADDLRYQAQRLETPGLTQDKLLQVVERIGGDAREYDSIAGAGDGRAELQRLLALLEDLQSSPVAPGKSDGRMDQIETSIATLVRLNEARARNDVASIRRSHRAALITDAIESGVTVVVIGIVGVALARSLRKQRQMLRTHLDALAERSRELEAFAARAAHDLRGPLMPIRGYADLIASGTIDVHEGTRRIRSSTDKLASIIDDLLSLSVAGRPPAGSTAVVPIVDELLEEFQTELQQAHAEVDVSVDECKAACTSGVLAQLLRNLIGNAIKYRSPKRSLALHIEAHPVDGRVELVVEDNGAGMSSEAAAHAFEPFYRARNTAAKGHGLGLAIVKRSVEALSGDCELASEEDRGTRITLRLPAAA